MYIKRFVKHYYIMLIPALLWLFFFSIVPMFGIVMAFQDYNPGMGILHSKFAVRGSILDVYSYSCEYPFRIDFFGDEIDTIRTFDVETQLSQVKRTEIEIVPELAHIESNKQCFLNFLSESTPVVAKDLSFVCDRIGQIYTEGFSSQSLTEQLEGATEVEAERIRHDMKTELNLVSPLDFKKAVAAHLRIEFGKVGQQRQEGFVSRS
jgi:transcription-repair coupling factor (superfamily II helicase)